MAGGRAWTGAEIARLIELREQGMSIRDIGIALGRSRGAVMVQRHKMKRARLIEQGGEIPRGTARVARQVASQAEPVQRPCLSCERWFPSEHVGNRVCAGCKSGDAWRSGIGGCNTSAGRRNGAPMSGT